jgi:hypothetical protein
MSDLTLEEKLSYAKGRAARKEAEKHFFDLNQPHFPMGFSVYNRGRGHWDVSAKQCPGKASAILSLDERNQTSERDGQQERAFRIRGEPGNVVVFDERWNPHRSEDDENPTVFKSVLGAMLWICEELMQEPKRSNGDD